MKKITGWLTIVFCSIIMLIFAIAVVAITLGILSKKPEYQMSTRDILTSVTGFLITISVLIFGLINGIKKVKRDKVINIIDFPEKLEISLRGQISYKDYRNLNLALNFKKPFFYVIPVIFLLFSMTFFLNQDSATNSNVPFYSVFIILGVFLITPLLTLYQIKKLYQTNKIFQKPLDYLLNNESIHIKGETVDSIQKWSHFFKIKETSDFFMLYQGKMIATLLDKKMFSDSELAEFKRFIKSINVIRE